MEFRVYNVILKPRILSIGSKCNTLQDVYNFIREVTAGRLVDVLDSRQLVE